MSFMFNPHPYDDPKPVNRPILDREIENRTVFSYKSVMEKITALVSVKNGGVVAIDGCPSAEFDRIETSVCELLAVKGYNAEFVHISSIYKTSKELEELFSENLPEDRVKDPVLLYGKLYKGKYETIFDSNKLENLKECLCNNSSSKVYVLIGQGAAAEVLWPYIDTVIFLDVTPKVIMLRTIAGKYKNIGDDKNRTLKLVQRRIYYIDLELAVHLRRSLIDSCKLDWYIASDHDDSYAMISFSDFREITKSLARQPFRCKPVYIEGVWGGHYVRNARKLPNVFRNIAWVFDLIPLEVSVLIDLGNHIIDIPYYTFVQMAGKEIMGEHIRDEFGGYFPIRFNYDDTFHSSGNMSIQCHPPKEFCMSNFGEHGTQDEGYYIVATGHGAKTYCGFKDSDKVDEFLDLVEKSEQDNTPIPYDEYVNSVQSVPGKQFLIPGGTIHASGRNQVILEIGSLTVGSYTFKLYDYLRMDLDGKPRPIHSYYGRKVLAHERDSAFVNARLCTEPRLIDSGDGWEEYLVGEDPLVYYSCRQLRFEKYCSGDVKDRFHVIALVDGEKVTVRSVSNPDLCYHLDYLDIVVIPNDVGKYEIVNEGQQPVVIYKVQVKESI